MSDIAVRIDDEIARQRKLKAEGRFAYTASDAHVTDGQRLAILVEEIGEVARAINEEDDTGLVGELVQCAAVCVAWLQAVDRREATS